MNLLHSLLNKYRNLMPICFGQMTLWTSELSPSITVTYMYSCCAHETISWDAPHIGFILAKNTRQSALTVASACSIVAKCNFTNLRTECTQTYIDDIVVFLKCLNQLGVDSAVCFILSLLDISYYMTFTKNML